MYTSLMNKRLQSAVTKGRTKMTDTKKCKCFRAVSLVRVRMNLAKAAKLANFNFLIFVTVRHNLT